MSIIKFIKPKKSLSAHSESIIIDIFTSIVAFIISILKANEILVMGLVDPCHIKDLSM